MRHQSFCHVALDLLYSVCDKQRPWLTRQLGAPEASHWGVRTSSGSSAIASSVGIRRVVGGVFMVATEGVDVDDRVKAVLEAEEEAALAAQNRLGKCWTVSGTQI